jgi:ubiquitin-like 1-activating enzyme E1 B
MGSVKYGKTVFDKIFTGDIQRLLSMEDMWKNRTPPTPLYYDELAATMQAQIASDVNGLKDQHTWNVRECFDMFLDRYVSEAKMSTVHKNVY